MWLLPLENSWRANGLLYCCYEVVLLYFRSGGPAVFWSRWLHSQRLKAEIVMFAGEILRYQPDLASTWRAQKTTANP
jgi:hypothetical protein